MFLKQYAGNTKTMVEAWALAAGAAGADIPEFVKDKIIGIEECPTRADILVAIDQACNECLVENRGHFPDPRGFNLHITPSGSLSLVWESDTHTIDCRLNFSAKGRLADNSLLKIFAEREDSYRIGAAEKYLMPLGIRKLGAGDVLPVGAYI
jgi:hypothetical protein